MIGNSNEFSLFTLINLLVFYSLTIKALYFLFFYYLSSHFLNITTYYLT